MRLKICQYTNSVWLFRKTHKPLCPYFLLDHLKLIVLIEMLTVRSEGYNEWARDVGVELCFCYSNLSAQIIAFVSTYWQEGTILKMDIFQRSMKWDTVFQQSLKTGGGMPISIAYKLKTFLDWTEQIHKTINKTWLCLNTC